VSEANLVAGGSLPLETREAPAFAISHKKLVMWLFIISDAVTFGALLYAYGYLRNATSDWPRPFETASVINAYVMTFVLVTSSLTMLIGIRAAKEGNKSKAITWSFITVVGGLIFAGLHVKEWLGLIGGGLRIFGNPWGSGLFGASEASAHQIVTLLRAAHADYRIGPDLVAALPTGGVDGTLAKRWHGHPARGRVRAKTGTLDKVITLAGFVGVDSGHPLAFAILTNDIPAGQRGPARAMADDMIDAIVAYLEPPLR
jgi:hypothetical protein